MCDSLENFPHKFALKKNLLSVHHRISVYDMGGEEIGHFHKEKSDEDRELLCFYATHHKEPLAWAEKISKDQGTEYILHAQNEKPDSFVITEEKLDNELDRGQIFLIEKNSEVIGKCQKTDFVHNKIVVTEEGQVSPSVVVKKAWKSVHDTWKVKLATHSHLLPWVIAFFAIILQREED